MPGIMPSREGLNRDLKWAIAGSAPMGGARNFLLDTSIGTAIPRIVSHAGRIPALTGALDPDSATDFIADKFDPVWKQEAESGLDFARSAIRKLLGNLAIVENAQDERGRRKKQSIKTAKKKRSGNTRGSIARGEKTAAEAQAEYFAGRYGR
jgi:hypothetical protein